MFFQSQLQTHRYTPHTLCFFEVNYKRTAIHHIRYVFFQNQLQTNRYTQHPLSAQYTVRMTYVATSHVIHKYITTECMVPARFRFCDKYILTLHGVWYVAGARRFLISRHLLNWLVNSGCNRNLLSVAVFLISVMLICVVVKETNVLVYSVLHLF